MDGYGLFSLHTPGLLHWLQKGDHTGLKTARPRRPGSCNSSKSHPCTIFTELGPGIPTPPKRNPWPEGQQPLRSSNVILFLVRLLFPVVFSGGVMLRSYFCIMRMCLQRHQHNPFICFHHTHRQKDLEILKGPPSPVLCYRRVGNNELPHGDQAVSFSLLSSCALSSHR